MRITIRTMHKTQFYDEEKRIACNKFLKMRSCACHLRTGVLTFDLSKPALVNVTSCLSGQSALNETNYFGKRVSVLFDDGNWYTGVVTGKDTTGCWVTKFEDGTEDTSMDPGKDKDYKLLP